MLTTFDSLKKQYEEKIESYKTIDDVFKIPVISQNVRKIDFLEDKLTNIQLSEYSPLIHYSDEKYFMAGKSLAIARLEYEIELLQACNNVLVGNDYTIDHESFSTDNVMETLNIILGSE